MKNIIFRNHSLAGSLTYILAVFCLIFIGLNDLTAQKKERTRLKAYYEKLASGQKKFSVSVTSGRGRDMGGVPYAEILMKNITADSTILLATLETDEMGESVLYVDEGFAFQKNEEGFNVVVFEYEGNDSLRGSDRDIEFQELFLRVTPEIIDSVKTVNIYAYKTLEEEEPVSDVKLKIGVKRLYSTLFLDDVETDEDGMASFNFPDDIPGDSEGNIILTVKLQDSDDFGTVTATKEVDWGVPVNMNATASERSLYGDSAPLWMIIAVGVILGGAWLHFLWAAVSVWRLKNNA
jgi:hypothetical protein